MDKVYPPDHYQGGCARPPMPMPWIRYLLKREQSDQEHAGERLTITRILGCQREYLISDNCGVVLDVRTLDRPARGTLMHKILEENAEPGTYTEVRVPPPGHEPPTLGGHPYTGRLDWVTHDYAVIGDYKCHSEFRQKHVIQPKALFSDVDAQLNLGRIGIAKSILKCDPEMYRPRMVVTHSAFTSTTTGIPAWKDVEAKYMSEEDLLAYKPANGNYTVRELLEARAEYMARKARGVPVRDNIKEVPLAGRRMISGNKCTYFCGMRGVCDDIEGIVRP